MFDRQGICAEYSPPGSGGRNGVAALALGERHLQLWNQVLSDGNMGLKPRRIMATHCRVECARALLGEPARTLTDVARAVGFQ